MRDKNFDIGLELFRFQTKNNLAEARKMRRSRQREDFDMEPELHVFRKG
jgi:hypothetical protein